MAVLPAGFSLPPLPYLLALLVGLGVVGWLLVRRRPPVTEWTVLALVPWVVLGAALHVLYVVDALPATVRPLAGTAAVYLTVGLGAGATWLVANRAAAGTERLLGGAGTAVALGTVVAALVYSGSRGAFRPVPAVGILVVAAAVAVATWVLLGRARPDVAVTGRPGFLAVAAHALDGVSTAVGYDVLGFGERTPLSRLLIDAGAALPTQQYVGAAWLFVLVKVLLACWVVALFADLVRDAPRRGRLLLAAVAAVGLGPGAHNLLLFTVAS